MCSPLEFTQPGVSVQGLLVVVGVTVECSTVPAHNVLQFAVWQISTLGGSDHYQAILSRIYPFYSSSKNRFNETFHSCEQ